MAPAASAAASAFSASAGTSRGHSGYGSFAASTTTAAPRAASPTDARDCKPAWTTSEPAGNRPAPAEGRTTARTRCPANRARRTTAPPIDPFAPRTTTSMPGRQFRLTDKADARSLPDRPTCTMHAQARLMPPGQRLGVSTRLGEAGEVRTMGNGIKLGPRATILLVVLLAASAVGILTPTLSNTVSKDVQVTGFAVTLTVDGIPETVAPGDVFRVTATLANNANRPVPAVFHEIQERDPAGYASLVVPGLNASAGVRSSGSAMLKALNYYAMVVSSNGESPNLADWTLSSVFSERFVAFGGAAQDGFLVEDHPQSRGSFIFKLWAERPDALGMPDHPTYTCGPL